MPSPTDLPPADAAAMMMRGARLIDIRETDERARLFIPGSVHAPLSRIAEIVPVGTSEPLIFHCRSGRRTTANVARLAELSRSPAFLLDGGIEAWRKAGLPVEADARQPIEIMRQVQVTAGLLILTGVLLGAVVAPVFYLLAGFIGAGLVMAGVTGWCGMAKLLGAMPWNRRRPSVA